MTWQQRLARAQKSGTFTSVDKCKVEQWQTCAVGEKMREQGVETFSEELTILGYDFFDAVAWNDVVDAQRLYKLIQAYKTRIRPKSWHPPIKHWQKERYAGNEEKALEHAQDRDMNYWNFVAQEITTFNQYVRGEVAI